jgi:hypothetical protein
MHASDIVWMKGDSCETRGEGRKKYFPYSAVDKKYKVMHHDV